MRKWAVIDKINDQLLRAEEVKVADAVFCLLPFPTGADYTPEDERNRAIGRIQTERI
jgi:hypothetical protein